jgi:hypothetical protein
MENAGGDFQEQRGRGLRGAAFLCALVMSLVLVSSASAKPRATVSWNLPPAVSEGVSIPFTWGVRHLGRHYRLVVQRPFGTAHVWKSIMRLPARSGSAELPGLRLGVRWFRIAAFRGKQLLAQEVSHVGVFGVVPFSVLLRNGNLTTGHLESGVYATASSSFPYIGGAYAGDHGRPNTIFSVNHNRCSGVHVDFVIGESPGEEYSYPGSVYGVVSVVQQSRDPVASEAPLNGIGSVDAGLVPGQAWSLLVEENNRDGRLGAPTVYFNGYAICDNREPFSG